MQNQAEMRNNSVKNAEQCQFVLILFRNGMIYVGKMPDDLRIKIK